MNKVINLTLSRNFKALDKLFYRDGSSYLFFKLNNNNVSAFDIVVQYIVKYNFRGKENLLKMMKNHFSGNDLFDAFLNSNLVTKINNGNVPFYSVMKNAFRFLHKVNPKEQIHGSNVIMYLDNAFTMYPKDAISLMKYLYKSNLIKPIENDPYVNIYFTQSPRMSRFALDKLGVEISYKSYKWFYITLFGHVFNRNVVQVNNYLSICLDEYKFLFSQSENEYREMTTEVFNMLCKYETDETFYEIIYLLGQIIVKFDHFLQFTPSFYLCMLIYDFFPRTANQMYLLSLFANFCMDNETLEYLFKQFISEKDTQEIQVDKAKYFFKLFPSFKIFLEEKQKNQTIGNKKILKISENKCNDYKNRVDEFNFCNLQKYIKNTYKNYEYFTTDEDLNKCDVISDNAKILTDDNYIDSIDCKVAEATVRALNGSGGRL